MHTSPCSSPFSDQVLILCSGENLYAVLHSGCTSLYSHHPVEHSVQFLYIFASTSIFCFVLFSDVLMLPVLTSVRYSFDLPFPND